ncbi:hypothetical protein ALC56_00377 [Trachymyrmex septentrionalis]|uniref:Uncharacterized protein n=1 Tax=Trachymyrmex septentrionalis TaxID=34720 RepID=A0A195FXU2_9HYME|nr:hypothetical protein ALC56_00377 [Trachymyrmex septentrionalis]
MRCTNIDPGNVFTFNKERDKVYTITYSKIKYELSLSLSFSLSLPLHFVLPLVKVLGRELYDTSLAISL